MGYEFGKLTLASREGNLINTFRQDTGTRLICRINETTQEGQEEPKYRYVSSGYDVFQKEK